MDFLCLIESQQPVVNGPEFHFSYNSQNFIIVFVILVFIPHAPVFFCLSSHNFSDTGLKYYLFHNFDSHDFWPPNLQTLVSNIKMFSV